MDLLLHADDGNVPSHFCRHIIFVEDFVCVVARNSAFGLWFDVDIASVSRGATYRRHHPGRVANDTRSTPQSRWDEASRRPPCSLLLHCDSGVAGTNLVATIPRRLATLPENLHSELRIARAPKLMGKFRYLMAWHPRMDSDSSHMWLRSSISEITKSNLALTTSVAELGREPTRYVKGATGKAQSGAHTPDLCVVGIHPAC